MDILKLLWLASWILAGAALVWMSALVLVRLGRERLLRGRQADLTAVEGAYLALMRGEAGALEALEPFRRRVSLLAETLLRMLDVVRGGERERLLAGLTTFGLGALLCATAGRAGPNARLAQVEAMGAFPGPATEQVLRRLSRRARGEVRLAAAKALSSMGAKGDLLELIADMTKGREPWSGSLGEVLRLLAEQQPDDCAKLFSRTDLPDPVRAMLAEVLGRSGDYRNMLGLAEAAMRGGPQVRAASVQALGRLMHPACAPVLAWALRDSDWQVRGASARAAGEAGFVDLAPRLAARLSDPVWWVSFQAADALTRLGPQGLETLRQAVKTGSDAASRVASLTLAERGLA